MVMTRATRCDDEPPLTRRVAGAMKKNEAITKWRGTMEKKWADKTVYADSALAPTSTTGT
jgi:hypothetical protein